MVEAKYKGIQGLKNAGLERGVAHNKYNCKFCEKNISTDHRAQSHLSGGHTRQWLLIHCIASLALALQLTAGKGRQTLGYREKDIHSPFPSAMGQCIVLGKQNVKHTLLSARRASPPSRRGIELGLNKNVMHTTGHLLKDYKGQIKLYPFL